MNDVNALVDAVFGTANNKQEGCDNPANWPASAKFAVRYSQKDKQFPSYGAPTYHYAYFDSYEEYEAWLDEKHEWIRGTDGDFTVDYSLYEWDLGPFVRRVAQI